jgi:hypothetical protein
MIPMANRAARQRARREIPQPAGPPAPRGPDGAGEPQQRRCLLVISALLLVAWIVFLAVMAGLARNP